MTKRSVFTVEGINVNKQIRRKLMDEVVHHITENKLSQRKASKQFVVAQPRLSDIKQGKVEKFTIDYLINLLSRIGIEVWIEVYDKEEGEGDETKELDSGDNERDRESG